MNDDKTDKICSAKFRAQEIKDFLHAYFWTDDVYHLKRALENLQELNKINLEEFYESSDTK